jgi:hypothetical protein
MLRAAGRIHGTYDEGIEARSIWLALSVRLEQFFRLLHHPAVTGDDAEASAAINIKVREVEAENAQLTMVDNHHLSVIPYQVTVGARDADTRRVQSHFELSQASLAASVCGGDESLNVYSTFGGVSQRGFHLPVVEPKNDNLDALLRLTDRFD